MPHALQVGISTSPVAPDAGPNTTVNEYFDWLQAIEHKVGW